MQEEAGKTPDKEEADPEDDAEQDKVGVVDDAIESEAQAASWSKSQ